MKVGYWNAWWTLTLIVGAATIVVAILEALGVFKDLGIALAIVGIILSVIFGMTASTRSAVTTASSALATLRGEIATLRGEIATLRDSLVPPLERILAILVERLPHARDH